VLVSDVRIGAARSPQVSHSGVRCTDSRAGPEVFGRILKSLGKSYPFPEGEAGT
jgi:hypothetical protein